jgi:chromosome segregation ATPase
MPMHEQIAELLSLPQTGEGAPTLAAVEDALTEGYAQALALEAERWRLERSLGDVAREAHDRDASEVATRLAALSERITSANRELARLRALLARLHDRARALRGTNGSLQGSPSSALAEAERG